MDYLILTMESEDPWSKVLFEIDDQS